MEYSSWWVKKVCTNVGKQARHFSYSFLTKNKNDLLNFTIQLIDSNSKDIEFIDGKNKFLTINFLIEFLI